MALTCGVVLWLSEFLGVNVSFCNTSLPHYIKLVGGCINFKFPSNNCHQLLSRCSLKVWYCFESCIYTVLFNAAQALQWGYHPGFLVEELAQGHLVIISKRPAWFQRQSFPQQEMSSKEEPCSWWCSEDNILKFLPYCLITSWNFFFFNWVSWNDIG